MLGILSAESSFAGGSFSLSKNGVVEAFETIGRQMGYTAEEAAFDCWRVVNANMSQGVRRITAGKGIDPKDLVVLAYGGNGPALSRRFRPRTWASTGFTRAESFAQFFRSRYPGGAPQH